MADMAAMEGPRSSGDEEMVVVMRERSMAVRGSTARGERGGAMLLVFGSWSVVVPVVEDGAKSWAVGSSSICCEGDERFEDE